MSRLVVAMAIGVIVGAIVLAVVTLIMFTGWVGILAISVGATAGIIAWIWDWRTERQKPQPGE